MRNQGQERCRLTYDSLYAISLHTCKKETCWGFFLQRMWRFIQLIPHRNWFKEAKLVASFICWDEIVTRNESSLRFLKARHLIDPLANQDSTKEKSRFAFLFSFVKTAICIIVTLFEGADLLLLVLPLHTQMWKRAQREIIFHRPRYQRQVSVFRNPS